MSARSLSFVPHGHFHQMWQHKIVYQDLSGSSLFCYIQIRIRGPKQKYSKRILVKPFIIEITGTVKGASVKERQKKGKGISH
jgi:hypothetical protein